MNHLSLNLPPEIQSRLAEREQFSRSQLDALKESFEHSKHLRGIPGLSIFASGSYGRLEGGPHSDIDLFFLCNKPRAEYAGFNISKIQMMSEIIDIARRMNFPEFSNDGEFLSVLFVPEILENLGGRLDDYENHFTARLLLLLEGRPISDAAAFEAATAKVIESYFRDYPYHPKNFRPTFLTNDIIRFWKTLCLNYENRRNELGPDQRVDQEKRRKQQIKNYKLKFSRLLTCFATIGNLSTFDNSIEPDDVAKLCSLAPIDRLAQIADKRPKAKTANVRNNLSIAELSFVMAAEALAAERIEEELRLGNDECVEASSRSAAAIRAAIESDRKTRQTRLSNL